jgi:diadenosine tetraphosphate (Ap4A) HIT family hydrolase
VGSTRGAACTFCDLDAFRAGAVLLLENNLLRQARPLLDERYKPDGFNIGWNCYAAGGGDPHAHMHVLLRFADEPKAGQGIRWPLRQADNRRPDPTAPGQGSRRFWTELNA